MRTTIYKISLPLTLLFLSIGIFAQECEVVGGRLTLDDGSSSVQFCLDRENDALINFTATDTVGEQFRYFITNSGATILRTPEGGPPFSLSGFNPGGILIWRVAYTGELIGDGIRDNLCMITSTTGCTNLSNPIRVNRITVAECPDSMDMQQCLANGGRIEFTDGRMDTTICVDNGPVPLAISRDGSAVGDSLRFVITDEQNNILAVPSGNGPFDLTPAGPGQCLIYYLSHDSTLLNLTVGSSVDSLEGCFALSNPLIVTRNTGMDCPDDPVDPVDATFVAILNGQQELPCPVTTTGFGNVTAELSGNTLTVSGSFSNLEADFDANIAGGAHLHAGMAGSGGPIVFLLDTDVDDDLRGGSFAAQSNTFELTDGQVDTLQAQGLYVNIHTTAHAAGEIRGQLLPSADDYSMAFLTGANENPSVMTPAIGGVAATLSGNTLTVSGSFSNLQGTIATEIQGGAHIHTGLAGRNGPIAFPLTLEINDDQTGAVLPAAGNVFTLSDEQVAALDMQMLYVNIHSEFERSGEIRGQLLPYSVATFYVEASGHQARPVPVNTTGNGKLMLSLFADSTLSVSGSIDDLQSPIATQIQGGGHLHFGLAGQSGPIDFVLNLSIEEDATGALLLPAENTVTLTGDQLESIYLREHYANFHTDAVPTGEIRGQVMNLATNYYGSNLGGINENPNAIKTTGNGFLLYEVCGNELVATGSFTDLISDFDASIMGGSHLHLGDAGSNGPIAQVLNANVADDLRSGFYRAEENRFTLDSAQLAALMTGGLYFNLHSLNYPAGEIRGQLLKDDNAFPTEPIILTPEDGAEVEVTEGDDGESAGTFQKSEDPDGDLLVYTVEITSPSDTGFANLLACAKIGVCTTSTATLDAVYDTLIARGAVVGMNIPLRYRVVASDGSVRSSGPSQAITLTMGDRDTCEVAGGTLALETGGEEITICADDGVPDTFEVSLSGNEGDSLIYAITDADGTILDPGALPPFDLEGAGAGACLIYAVSSSGEIIGLEMGASINELEGCFALSNPITVIRNTGSDCDMGEECEVTAGMISLIGGSVDTTICIDNGPAPIEVIDDGSASGDSLSFVITDDVGMILSVPAGAGPFDLTLAGSGQCLIYYVAHDETLTGLTEGGSIDSLGGCFELSNAITVTRNSGDDCDDRRQDNFFFAVINGIQELPCPVTTTGYGTAQAVLSGNTLQLEGTFGNLESDFDSTIAGGAHIHLGPAGIGGPIAFRLVTDLDDDLRGGSFETADNRFELTDEEVSILRDHGFYINIHTEDHPGGEIRGQILPGDPIEYYSAVLLGVNEVPSVTSTGMGTAVARFREGRLTVSGGFSNLASDLSVATRGGAHLHLAVAGRNGPIAFELAMDIDSSQRTASFITDDNVFELDDDQIEALENNGIYVNIHSAANRSGELRGQLAPHERLTSFLADLSGHQEQPEPVDTEGNGKLMVDVDPNGQGVTVSGSVNGLSTPILTSLAGGGHLHIGLAGESDEIIFPLLLQLDDNDLGAVINPQGNFYDLQEEQLEAFYDRGIYANFHTTDFEAGEIRGQVLNLAKGYFGSNLSGNNALPITPSLGTGFLVYELYDGSIVATGAFGNLDSAYDPSIGSHLHIGNAASTGPVVIALDPDFSDDGLFGQYIAEENTFPISSGLADTLRNGGIYFNLHTVEYPAGEIRGQVLRADDAFPSESRITSPESGSTVMVFSDSISLEEASLSESFDPDGDLVVYIVQVTTIDDTEFNDPLFVNKFGSSTLIDSVLSSTFMALNDTLLSGGLPPGTSLNVLYRILASDGSVETVGPTDNLTLVFGDREAGLSQPRINEITADGEVELINNSDQTVDLGDYLLGGNRSFGAVDELEIVCGGLRLKPGEIITVRVPNLNPAGGELVLMSTDEQGNSNDLLSYVAWGESDRSMEGLALFFEVWKESMLLTPLTPDASIQLVARSSPMAYAMAAPTVCAPNQLTTSTTQPAADALMIYPNPVNRQLTVEYQGLRASDTELQLFDLNGRLLLRQQLNGRNGRVQLSTALLPAGTYTLRVANEAGLSVTRIVKH